MNIKEMAKLLDGAEYLNEMTKETKKLANDNGFLVIFGYSDDIVELSGVIDDEVGAYDGTTIYLDKNGILEECEENCKYYSDALKNAKTVKAVWNEVDNASWTYETDMPHETFEIYDCGELYCIGIVIDFKKSFEENVNV